MFVILQRMGTKFKIEIRFRVEKKRCRYLPQATSLFFFFIYISSSNMQKYPHCLFILITANNSVLSHNSSMLIHCLFRLLMFYCCGTHDQLTSLFQYLLYQWKYKCTLLYLIWSILRVENKIVRYSRLRDNVHHKFLNRQSRIQWSI